jgi:TonB family protein
MPISVVPKPTEEGEGREPLSKGGTVGGGASPKAGASEQAVPGGPGEDEREEAAGAKSESEEKDVKGERAGKAAPLLHGKKTARYASFDTHELVTLIEDLEDDRWKARVREGIWISIIVHLLVFWWILYGPQVILHHPRLRNPGEVLAERERQTEILNLPPDALKEMQPKHTNVISDKNRVAQTKAPTLDQKTLQQLEEMKRAGPPKENEAPPEQAQQGQQQAPAPPTPQQQVAKMEPPPVPQPPTPQPTVPNFKKYGTAPGDMIQQAVRGAAAHAGAGGGDFGASAPVRHPGIQSGMEILSDTMGVDFGPYLAHLKFLIETAWYPLIPESARPPLLKQGVVGIDFTIDPDGNLAAKGGVILHTPSGDVALDRAAWGGITGASPFPPLPKEFKGQNLKIRGYFLYNKKPEDLK